MIRKWKCASVSATGIAHLLDGKVVKRWLIWLIPNARDVHRWAVTNHSGAEGEMWEDLVEWGLFTPASQRPRA